MSGERHSPNEFHTTRWSMIALASQVAGGSKALGELCRLYWHPLYHFARARGMRHEDACDAVQGLFEAVVEDNVVARAVASRGRFRSFLIGCFRHHLSDLCRHDEAKKRGGGTQAVPWDEAAEEMESLANHEQLSPEVAYDRRWAMTVLATAAARLKQEMEGQNLGDRLAVLEPFILAGAPEMTYAEAAAQLNAPENRVRTWIHRLRQRRAQLVREVVAETVSDPAEVDDELRHLLSVIA
jgi:RNA polymerase sigma factor (sigma-70 family)